MIKLMFVVFCMIGYTPGVFGQIVSVAPLPVIEDPGVTLAAGALAIEYILLEEELKKMKTPLKSFVREYVKRGAYYVGTVVMEENNVIGNKVTAVETRIGTLEADNLNLSLLYYSKKKATTKLLIAVKEEFAIVKAELSTSSKAVVMGEKLNLYQDAMITLTRINRELDVIENNIRSSETSKRVIEKMSESTPITP